MSEDLENEIAAINSIYGKNTLLPNLSPDHSSNTVPSSVYVLTFPSAPLEDGLAASSDHQDSTVNDYNSTSVTLRVRFPPTYPFHDPPTLIGVASVGTASKGHGTNILNLARRVLEERFVAGNVCIFDVIEGVVEGLAEKAREEEEGSEEEDAGHSIDGAHYIKSRSSGEQSSYRGIEGPECTEAPVNGGDATAIVQSHKDHNEETAHLLDASKSLSRLHLHSATPTCPPTTSLLPQPSPQWTLSSPQTHKKSTFLGRATFLPHPNLYPIFMQNLLDSDRHARDATHNISAVRVRVKTKTLGSGAGAGGVGGVEEDFDDDGESGAGRGLLRVLRLTMERHCPPPPAATTAKTEAGASTGAKSRGGKGKSSGGGGNLDSGSGSGDDSEKGILVVVSRWYGGVKLGPARFAVIGDVGREAVVRLLDQR